MPDHAPSFPDIVLPHLDGIKLPRMRRVRVRQPLVELAQEGGGGAKVGRADAAVLATRSVEAGLVATGGGGVIRGVFGAGGAATGRGGATGRSAVAAEGLLTRGGGATGGGGGGIRTDEGALTALRWVVGVGARTGCRARTGRKGKQLCRTDFAQKGQGIISCESGDRNTVENDHQQEPQDNYASILQKGQQQFGIARRDHHPCQ